MSAFYFCKVFKGATGLTFTDYIARARIEKTKQLLLNPHMRVSEAAYEAGFQSLSQFNRVFRRIVGESPTTYRCTICTAPPPAPRRAVRSRLPRKADCELGGSSNLMRSLSQPMRCTRTGRRLRWPLPDFLRKLSMNTALPQSTPSGQRIAVLGGGITGLTAAWHLRRAGFAPVVFEQAAQPGGAISAVRQDGWLHELGPNSLWKARPMWRRLSTKWAWAPGGSTRRTRRNSATSSATGGWWRCPLRRRRS